MTIFHYQGIIGSYTLEESKETLTHLWFNENYVSLPPETNIQETPLLKEAHAQLNAYFAKRLKKFTLPLAPEGTDFQHKIWQLLQHIPYGETRTYGEIAALSGNPKASRSVGNANNHNPLPIFIPCHRVIGQNGQLTGYAGGLDLKKLLLHLEGLCF